MGFMLSISFFEKGKMNHKRKKKKKKKKGRIEYLPNPNCFFK